MKKVLNDLTPVEAYVLAVSDYKLELRKTLDGLQKPINTLKKGSNKHNWKRGWNDALDSLTKILELPSQRHYSTPNLTTKEKL